MNARPKPDNSHLKTDAQYASVLLASTAIAPAACTPSTVSRQSYCARTALNSFRSTRVPVRQWAWDTATPRADAEEPAKKLPSAARPEDPIVVPGHAAQLVAAELRGGIRRPGPGQP